MSRLEINGHRIVVAKEGFDAADPGLADEGKILDSEWLFAGTVIMAGVYADTAPPSESGSSSDLLPHLWIYPQVRTFSDTDIVVNFPAPLDFIPTVLLLPLADPYYWTSNNNPPMGLSFNPFCTVNHAGMSVTNSGFRLPREHFSGSKYSKFSFVYLVMSI